MRAACLPIPYLQSPLSVNALPNTQPRSVNPSFPKLCSCQHILLQGRHEDTHPYHTPTSIIHCHTSNSTTSHKLQHIRMGKREVVWTVWQTSVFFQNSKLLWNRFSGLWLPFPFEDFSSRSLNDTEYNTVVEEETSEYITHCKGISSDMCVGGSQGFDVKAILKCRSQLKNNFKYLGWKPMLQFQNNPWILYYFRLPSLSFTSRLPHNHFIN